MASATCSSSSRRWPCSPPRVGTLRSGRRAAGRRRRWLRVRWPFGIAEPAAVPAPQPPEPVRVLHPAHRRAAGGLRPVRDGLLGQLRPAGGRAGRQRAAERAQMPLRRHRQCVGGRRGRRGAFPVALVSHEAPGRIPSGHPAAQGIPTGRDRRGRAPRRDSSCDHERRHAALRRAPRAGIPAAGGTAQQTGARADDRSAAITDHRRLRRAVDPLSGQRRVFRFGRALQRHLSPARVRFATSGDAAWQRSARAPAGSSGSSRTAGASTVVALEPSDAFYGAQGQHRCRTRSDRVPQGDRRSPAADGRSRLRVFHRRDAPHSRTRRPWPRRPFAPSGPAAPSPSGCTAAKATRPTLLVAGSLWGFTRRLPHRGLDLFVRRSTRPSGSTCTACRWLPLPLAAYMQRVMLPLTPAKRRVVIYDQLNPAYAKYYTRAEAEALMTDAGFVDIRLHHRHGYSWSRHRPQARRHETTRVDCRAGLQRGGDARRVRLAPGACGGALSNPATRFEFVLVDDGSTDGSLKLARTLIASEPRLRVVELRRNFGQTPALQAGLGRRTRRNRRLDGLRPAALSRRPPAVSRSDRGGLRSRLRLAARSPGRHRPALAVSRRQLDDPAGLGPVDSRRRHDLSRLSRRSRAASPSAGRTAPLRARAGEHGGRTGHRGPDPQHRAAGRTIELRPGPDDQRLPRHPVSLLLPLLLHPAAEGVRQDRAAARRCGCGHRGVARRLLVGHGHVQPSGSAAAGSCWPRC